MANQVVKVKRETIAACMTCPLCNKLFREATSITECLHTFCKRCIYDKISDDELKSCPVCNIDLGCSPLEKLRPDHSLQDIRAKIFPSKRRRVKAPEPPSVTLPVRRKERSLSSLFFSTPRVSSQTAMTTRKTRGVGRKASAFRHSSFSIVKPIKKEELLAESSNSPEVVDKFMTPNMIQVKESSLLPSSSSPVEPSEALPNKETENDGESRESKMDLWKPSNYLVDVANRTKPLKPNSHAFDARVEIPHITDTETLMQRNRRKSKVEDENHVDPANLESERPKKVQRNRRERTSISEESGVSPQAVLGANHERRFGPIWFSLVASEDQEGDAPLPQIPASYLRVKDGNVPVSFVQKYLVRKLNLASETEMSQSSVEIRCMGQAVGPSLQLYHLVDVWLRSRSSQCIQASIGSSAKDFVMVLSYSRKV